MNFINNNDRWEAALSEKQDFQEMNRKLFEQSKYLSYGFFHDQVLSPALEEIKKGHCAVSTYLRHPYIHEFHQWMEKQCAKEGLPYFFVDCDASEYGIVTLPFHELPDKGVIVFYNPTLNNGAVKDVLGEKKWSYMLFQSWALAKLEEEGRLDVAAFNHTMSSSENRYLFQPIEEERLIKRGDYAIFYVDFDDTVAREAINESYLNRHIDVYGSFMIPNANFRFLEWACRQPSVALGEMREQGKQICNL